MSIVSQANTHRELDRIAETVHDQRFWVEHITYDQAHKILRIPFEKEDRCSLRGHWYQLLFHRWSVPVYEYVLEIRCASSYTIEDEAQISRYTINRVFYDLETSQVRLRACEDCAIIVDVTDLHIVIIDAHRALGARRVWTILGCEIS